MNSIGSWAFADCDSFKTINCEAESKPDGWDDNWIGYTRAEIVWGYDSKSGARSAKASTINIEDFEINDGVLVKYKGNGGDVIIPDGVKEIGEKAFYSCHLLTNLTISNSVTSIGEYAFYDCESLTSINVSSGNRKFKSIDGNLYSYDGKTLVQYAIGKTVTSLTLPDGITSIGDNAFGYCQSLTSVTIPNGVIFIGKMVFRGCKSLESVNIPNSVTSIGAGAFYDCESLTSIIIPNGVTFIDRMLFNGCYRLESIVIPNSVTSIGGYAFDFCKSLKSITLPNGVTSIDEYAFWQCYSLESITIPDSVTSIGEYAFCRCESLTSIIINRKVTYIGEQVFYGCEALKSITIPKNVLSIGVEAFSDCESLETIYCEAESKPDDWKEEWLGNCNAKVVWGYNGSASRPKRTTSDTQKVSVTQFTVKSSDFETKNGVLVKYKGNGGDVVIPDGITTIGDNAFYDCKALTSVIIPEGVTTIGWNAFQFCSRLSDVTLPFSLTTIKGYAFNCSGIKNITIPRGVISIGNCAFGDCENLTNIEVSPDNERFKSIDGNLYNYNGKKIVQYATGKKDSTFNVPRGVTVIGFCAFDRSNNLKSVVIPESVTSVEYGAFKNCHKMQTIYCRAKKPFLGLPSGWDKEWLGKGNWKCSAQIVWNYKG